MLKNRGPDSFEVLKVQLNEYTLLAAVSVLSLRGSSQIQVTKQPLVDASSGNILLWNGELFASDLIEVNSDENDAQKILEKLCDNFDSKSEKEILAILESIKGPFGFVFYEKKSNRIYFGRDKFGRRSLLFNANKLVDSKTPLLMLSSVQVNMINFKFENEFNELKASAFYSLDLNESEFNLNVHFWKKLSEESMIDNNNDQLKDMFPYEIKMTRSNLCLNDRICELNKEFNILKDETKFQNLIDELLEKLKQSVSRRVKNLPNNCKECSKKSHLKFSDSTCEHAKLAILFSGGVDSSVLAAVADLCLPENEPIDLINIAFEKQKKKDDQNASNDEFLVPDRISGLKSLKELNPNRKWNFIEINVTLDELRYYFLVIIVRRIVFFYILINSRLERERVIKHLLFPHVTVLDDSIGCALWFASRGVGHIRSADSVVPYKSNAEVLLLGMGADEQLAGYARHRTRFEKEGFNALISEVKMEMRRISERNLGRDDRIISGELTEK